MRPLLLIYLGIVGMIACKSSPPATTSTTDLGREQQTMTHLLKGNIDYKIVSVNKLLVEEIDFGNRQPYLKFDMEKSILSGNAGCNQINGKFKINGDTLVLGKIAATRMMCPSMAFEQDVLGILNEGTLTLKKISDELILRSANGELTMRATKEG